MLDMNNLMNFTSYTWLYATACGLLLLHFISEGNIEAQPANDSWDWLQPIMALHFVWQVHMFIGCILDFTSVLKYEARS